MKLQDELEFILNTLKSFPDGASLDSLIVEVSFSIERRTLQRRLKKLRENNLVFIEGGSHTTRYFAVVIDPSFSEIRKADEIQTAIPLSLSGEEILVLLSRSENQRKPVGYERAFLEEYRPNIDAYLTNEDKHRLTQLDKAQEGVQPAGTYAREILNRLLIDLSWNSSRLEGNTYSLLDTELLIHEGQVAKNKSAKENQMILNHKEAIEFLVESSNEVGFDRYTILNLHALLSNNLLPNPAAQGRLRNFGVGITNSVFVPLGPPQLIEEFFDLLLTKTRQEPRPV